MESNMTDTTKGPYDQLAELVLEAFIPGESTKYGGRVFKVGNRRLNTKGFVEVAKRRIKRLDEVQDITVETRISKTLIARGHRLKSSGPRRPHRRKLTEPPAKSLTTPMERELKTYILLCGGNTKIHFEAYDPPQNVRTVQTDPLPVASRPFSSSSK